MYDIFVKRMVNWQPHLKIASISWFSQIDKKCDGWKVNAQFEDQQD